jgi:hypothetical protein
MRLNYCIRPCDRIVWLSPSGRDIPRRKTPHRPETRLRNACHWVTCLARLDYVRRHCATVSYCIYYIVIAYLLVLTQIFSIFIQYADGDLCAFPWCARAAGLRSASCIYIHREHHQIINTEQKKYAWLSHGSGFCALSPTHSPKPAHCP